MTPSRPARRRTRNSRSASSPQAKGSARANGMRTNVKSTSMSGEQEADRQQDAEGELEQPGAPERLVERGTVGMPADEAHDGGRQRQRQPRQPQTRRPRAGDPRELYDEEGEVDHRPVQDAGPPPPQAHGERALARAPVGLEVAHVV